MNRSLFPETEENRQATAESTPLADRMRPRSLDEVSGQDHLLGPDGVLRKLVEADRIPSMVLWGPPGVGKTTIARLVAKESQAEFAALSAVLAGVKDVRRITESARHRHRAGLGRTILFIDEIHRFNKAQQDAFLPFVENGEIILIGATTENPSFEVISPLLSRARVFVLKALSERNLLQILARALQDSVIGLGAWNLSVEPGVLEKIALFSNGDARQALNCLELCGHLARQSDAVSACVSTALLKEALQKRTLLYDKSGEEHFNLISAFHKSLRNSDVDASLYWLGRMLEAGEDPRYILRRMVRFASEDVGLADPEALARAVDSWRAFDLIGLPEGKLALAQAVAYLARAPKSNAVYKAYSEVVQDVEATRNEPVPLHLRNASTSLMKGLGYGKGYRYAHDEGGRVEEMDCLPDSLRGRRYWEQKP